jgi:hypothetical protein
MNLHERNRQIMFRYFAKMKRVLGPAWVKMSIQAKRSVIRNCVQNQQKPLACQPQDVAGYLSILAEAERRFT